MLQGSEDGLQEPLQHIQELEAQLQTVIHAASDPRKIMLKAQDSFGEFYKFFLDLQKVQEIIRKYHWSVIHAIVLKDIL